MPNFLKKAVTSITEFVYKHFEKNSGSMILLTSIIGIALSCFAQSGAILLNKNYTKNQKAFMIPQELTDGLLTVVSMFLVSKPSQKLAKMLVKTGKLTSKDILQYLKKNGLAEKRGKLDFDIEAEIKKIIEKTEQSDIFIKSTDAEKQKLLEEHNIMLKNYEVFSDTSSAIATTAATMTTMAIITPVLRNSVAAYTQKRSLNYLDTHNNSQIGKNILFKK